MSEQDRIEALERALESGENPTEEIASLVALVRMLEGLPEPEIDETFAASLEGRLTETAAAPAAAAPAAAAPAAAAAVASAAAAPAGTVATIARIEERRRRRIRRGMVAAIAAAMMLALPVAASADATPGSAGYGIRLGREEARLWNICRSGAVRCGFAHLDRATMRMQDLRGVLRRGDLAQVQPTSRRLRRDLSTGARTILQAAPPRTTLRRLAQRLDEAAVEMESLAAAMPADLRLPIREAMGDGESLSLDVLIALGDVPVGPPFDGPPPVAIGPPAPPQRQPDAPAPPAKTQTPRKQTTKPGNSFGPGGTPQIQKPKPGEEWSGDESLRDDCPLGVVAAPGVDAVCGATQERRP